MSDPFVSGSYGFNTPIRVKALTEFSCGLPQWIGFNHEIAHMEIATNSTFGHFQGLLRHLKESAHLNAEELTALRGLETRLIESTFQTHEGVAVWCTSLEILAREPTLLPKYIKTLNQAYRDAFRRISPLLPKPEGVFNNNNEYQRYRILAILFGIYCCSTPVFDVFMLRAKLLDWRDMHFETPDLRLNSAGKQPDKFLDIAKKMSPILASGISRIWDGDFTVKERQSQLQTGWANWVTEYERLIAEAGQPHYAMSLQALYEKRDALINAWGLSKHVKTRAPKGIEGPEPGLRAEMYLPDEVSFKEVRIIDRLEDALRHLARLRNNCSSTLLVVRDSLPQSFSLATKYSVNNQGELIYEEVKPGRMEVVIVENGAEQLAERKAPISISSFKASSADICRIGESTNSEEDFWVVDGSSYIRRQMLAHYSPASAYRVPNPLMYFRSLSELLFGMRTLDSDFREYTYAGVVEHRSPIAFLIFKDEFMFALVPDIKLVEIFLDAAKEMGARDYECMDSSAEDFLSVRARTGLATAYLFSSLENQNDC